MLLCCPQASQGQLPSAQQLQQCDALFVTGSAAPVLGPAGAGGGGAPAWQQALLAALPGLVASSGRRTVAFGSGSQVEEKEECRVPCTKASVPYSSVCCSDWITMLPCSRNGA